MTENNHFGDHEEPFSPKKRAKSFSYAFKGIFYMMRTQHNFWIQVIIGLLAIFLGFILNISMFDWGLVILACGMVLAAETFNSAVEALTDIVQPEQDPRAGRVKDLAAGAVLIAAIAAVVVGLLIFVPRIIILL